MPGWRSRPRRRRRVSFTGSAAAGRVGGPAGRRAAPRQCEMGGQNAAHRAGRRRPRPAAAIDRARRHGLRRPEVHGDQPRDRRAAEWRPVRDALVAEVSAWSSRIRPTPPVRWGRSSPARPAPPRSLRSSARVVGGRPPAGRRRRVDGAGHYLAPALVEVADPGAELAQEEVFAPVAAVLRARDAAHAVELTNGVRYGLVDVDLHARSRSRARPGRPARHGPRSREPADVGCRPARTVRRREGLGPRPAGAGEGRARLLHIAADDSRLARRGRIVTRSKSGGSRYIRASRQTWPCSHT